MTFSECRLIVACMLVFACSGDSTGDGDSTAAIPGAAVVPGMASENVDSGVKTVAASGNAPTDSSGTARNVCVHDGRWALCSVERRLRQAGFVAKPVAGTPSRRAGFSVAPAVYTLGRSRIELFVYPDEKSLARDMAGIDTIRVAPPGVAGTWETTPILVRSANLAAVLMSQNQRQVERFSLAITAGAPQPGSPR